jgi:hypothetical protein
MMWEHSRFERVLFGPVLILSLSLINNQSVYSVEISPFLNRIQAMLQSSIVCCKITDRPVRHDQARMSKECCRKTSLGPLA